MKSAAQVILISLSLVLLVEFVVRLTTDVGRLGVEGTLFTNNAWLDSYGNTPNISAVAFGVKVQTNEFGFRVRPGERAESPQIGDVLILGDSVAFGVGVEYQDIAASIVAAALPTNQVSNAAVIGHSTADHLNVAKVLLTKYPNSVQHIVVVYCLNDLSEASARRIQNRSADTRAKVVTPAVITAGLIDAALVDRLRNSTFFRDLNDLLRAHSNLYVLVRGLMTDPQGRYWVNLLSDYEALASDGVAEVLAPMLELQSLATAHQVELSVIIAPFAEQMRLEDSAYPQELVGNFLATAGIAHLDLLPKFLAAEKPTDLFLPYDPVHLSAAGHELLAEGIQQVLASEP